MSENNDRRPMRVDREDLPFEPTKPYVYWCSGCEEFVDVDDTSEHVPEDDDHPGVVRLSRVALGEELG